jgi:hypothetical protein
MWQVQAQIYLHIHPLKDKSEIKQVKIFVLTIFFEKIYFIYFIFLLLRRAF